MTIDTFYELDDSKGNPVLTTKNRGLALLTYRELHKTDPAAVPAVIMNGEYCHDASVRFDREAHSS